MIPRILDHLYSLHDELGIEEDFAAVEQRFLQDVAVRFEKRFPDLQT